jgi:hypothetical protein
MRVATILPSISRVSECFESECKCCDKGNLISVLAIQIRKTT